MDGPKAETRKWKSNLKNFTDPKEDGLTSAYRIQKETVAKLRGNKWLKDETGLYLEMKNK